MNLRLLIICLLTSLQLSATVPAWIYVDFDYSMKTAWLYRQIGVTTQVVGINGNELYVLFKSLYNKNNLQLIKPSQQLKIPKTIHQVWLGGPVPEAFKVYMQSWIDMHPGWEHRFWTDETVVQFPLINQEFYDRSDNFGVKSDILKWELIYRIGGVYIDTDFECLKPLDILHYTYDFYTGIQPLDSHFLQLGAALFAAAPGHPILKHCIETIKDDWHEKGAPKKTGPVHFTKSFFKVAGKTGLIDIALPSGYFYPLFCSQKELRKDLWLTEGAYAVHHWAKSWMPAEFRKDEFKNLSNDESCTSWND